MNAPLVLVTADDALAALAEADGPSPDAPTRTYRRRRRRGQRETDKSMHNHQTDRWMVSYADFITLLFAFFVVMYAMSSVNEGRYRVLSGALSTAFSAGEKSDRGGRPADAQPVAAATTPTVVASTTPAPDAATAASTAATDGKPSTGGATTPSDPVKPTLQTEPPIDPVDRAEIARTAERVQHMTALATKVDDRLQSLVRDGQVQVTRGARGIAIEINAAVLFDAAHADLKPASFDALRSLAQVLSSFVEPLQIEGHSDDVPIATREFRSNWELSAARAASVGRFLIDQGVAPGRIGIAGYAEFRPLVANASAETRARNRRVTLVILSADDTKPKEGGAKEEGVPTVDAEPAAAR